MLIKEKFKTSQTLSKNKNQSIQFRERIKNDMQNSYKLSIYIKKSGKYGKKSAFQTSNDPSTSMDGYSYLLRTYIFRSWARVTGASINTKASYETIGIPLKYLVAGGNLPTGYDARSQFLISSLYWHLLSTDIPGSSSASNQFRSNLQNSASD